MTALTWQNTPPDRPGYYWVRPSANLRKHSTWKNSPAMLVRVFERYGRLYEETLDKTSTTEPCPVEDLRWEWAGPIQEPEGYTQ